MTPQQQIFALAMGFALFFVIIDLVRRRRLREEYSWLWLGAGMVMVVIVVWYDLLVAISTLIGAKLVTTTLFLFTLIFLILINIHYAIKISALTNQLKELAQAFALHAAPGEGSPGAETGERPE